MIVAVNLHGALLIDNPYRCVTITTFGLADDWFC